MIETVMVIFIALVQIATLFTIAWWLSEYLTDRFIMPRMRRRLATNLDMTPEEVEEILERYKQRKKNRR